MGLLKSGAVRDLAATPLGYYARSPAFHDITARNSWYWNARRG